MSARLNYDKCPVCGEIRNTAGMTMHLRHAHGIAPATTAGAAA